MPPPAAPSSDSSPSHPSAPIPPSWSSAPRSATPLLDRACLAAAFALTLAWFFIYNQVRPDLMVDEPGHIGNILHFLDGKPGWPPPMTMLPGYHYLVVSLWHLHPPFGIVTLARLVTTACSCLGLLAFALAWRQLHRASLPNCGRGFTPRLSTPATTPNSPSGSPSSAPASIVNRNSQIVNPTPSTPPSPPSAPLSPSSGPLSPVTCRLSSVPCPLSSAGPATLLFALLPILQPFTGLAYTDAPALAFALLAVALHFNGHRALAVLAFLPALATRQTNVLWPALLVAWEFLRPDLPRHAFIRDFLHRTWLLLVLLVLCSIAIVIALKTAGRLTPGTETGNDLHFNPASLHTAGLLALLLGLPVWLAQLPATLRTYAATLRSRPALTVTLTVLALAAAILAGRTFSNLHQWNRDLFWDGCSFTLLRNWPLVWLDHHVWLRYASGLALVAMTAALALVIARQRLRLLLILALAFGLLQPFTNGLIEPRYFIPAAGFFLLFLDLTPTTTRHLALWWFLLCALHAPFIARGLSLW